jgi:hypothetical protein
MANLTSVGIVNGVPDSGTGTVSTLDNLPTLLANLPVNATIVGSGSVPSGAATSALQTTGNTSLASILSALQAALPLPTGAATASNQSTGNTSLASILSALQASTPQVGYANMASGQATIASGATLIASARTGAPGTGRGLITIVNTTTQPMYVGGSGVTTSTGQLLPGVVGASITLPFQGAVYAAGGSSSVVTYTELY